MIPARRTKTSTGAALGALLFALCLMPFTTLLYGATFAKLWEWFVADTFGVYAISALEAAGISSVVTFVTYQRDARVDRSESPWEAIGQALSFALVHAVLALAIGAVIKGFIG